MAEGAPLLREYGVLSLIESSNLSVSANMSISSTTYFDIIDFPHNFPPIGGSTQLTGDGHLSNTVEYSIPTTVRQDTQSVILEISKPIRSSRHHLHFTYPSFLLLLAYRWQCGGQNGFDRQ